MTAKLFQHFGSSSKSVSRFADRDVQDKLVDSKLPHGIGSFIVTFRHDGRIGRGTLVTVVVVEFEFELDGQIRVISRYR